MDGKLRPRKISEVAWYFAYQVPDARFRLYAEVDGPRRIRSNPRRSREQLRTQFRIADTREIDVAHTAGSEAAQYVVAPHAPSSEIRRDVRIIVHVLYRI